MPPVISEVVDVVNLRPWGRQDFGKMDLAFCNDVTRLIICRVDNPVPAWSSCSSWWCAGGERSCANTAAPRNTFPAEYAASHQMEIVREYSDHGRSGLNIAGQEGLNTLMAAVEGKRADFSALLVCDVSQWGRFQDVDESAYYEYVLKRASIRVHYCAEQFENDGSMSSSVLKTLKRSMAAEYSRELSVKVFSGQCRLIELGFRQGVRPGTAEPRYCLANPRRQLRRRQ